MKRRSALASLGAISFGINSNRLSPLQEVEKEPYQVKKQSFDTDVVVVGGGTAGVVAAIQVARAGRKVILIENGSQLGGTTTTGGVAFPGIFFAWGKQIIGGIGWEMVQEAVALNDDELPNFSVPHGRQHWRHQVRLNGQLYAMLIEEKCVEAGVAIRYYETPTSAVFAKDSWKVQTIGKGTNNEIRCKQLIDCTGNGFVSSLAGYTLLREPEIQPGTLMFQIGGYDIDTLDMKMIQSAYQKAIERGELTKTDFRNNIGGLLRSQGDNIQHIMGADSTTSDTHTIANIKGRQSLLSTLRFLRTLPGLEKTKIIDVQNETAIRETYRIDGHYKITHEDYVTGKMFDDAISYSYYPIDVHDENGVVPDHLAEGIVATIPLRSLVPKGSKNFLVAGRCVSSDRLANSALRIQASCMGMGQAAGAAAALGCKLNKSPLDIPILEIHRLIRENGGIVPGIS